MVSAISRYLIDFQVDKPFEGVVGQSRIQDAAEPVEDTASLIREAEARARTEERSTLQAKIDEAVAAERQRADLLLTSSREKWIREESERLASGYSEALRSMEANLVSRMARILTPFLTERMCARILDELREVLAALADSKGVSMTIRGPADLLSELKDKLGDRFSFADFIADESTEVRVTAGDAVIETQFAAWAQRLAGAVEQN